MLKHYVSYCPVTGGHGHFMFLHPPFLSIFYVDSAAPVMRRAQSFKMQARNAETNAYVKETKSTVKIYLNVTGYSAKHCVALYNIHVHFCLSWPIDSLLSEMFSAVM
jgi:hypothetical protein